MDRPGVVLQTRAIGIIPAMTQSPAPAKSNFCPVTAGVCALNRIQPWFLLAIRLYIGYQSMVAGLGHLQNIDKTAAFFDSLHIPHPRLNVYIAGLTEYVGGFLLMVGFLARLVAIPFSFNFVIAILSTDLAEPHFVAQTGSIIARLFHLFGKFVDNQDIVLKDDAFPFLCVGLIVLFFGPGKFSLDEIFVRPIFRRRRTS